MGKLVDGTWHDVWYASVDGRFVRKPSRFRQWITSDGSSPYPAASGRYHLYVSWACPWAHRTLIVRALMALQDHISVSVVEPLMLSNGWEFSETFPDHVAGARYLWERYVEAQPTYSGRVTVPLLWDCETATAVSNESSEIIRMLNQAFGAFTQVRSDHYPRALRAEIDAINDRVYECVNNGVYRAGFATSQEAYDEAVRALFDTLDWLEQRLAAGREFLVGSTLTEADIRLFTTLVRFDHVYHSHFKCNLARLVDYPQLASFTRRIYEIPGVAETVHLDHTKVHYFGSHRSINPHGIVPAGPLRSFLDLAP